MSDTPIKVILTGDKEEIVPLSVEELAQRDESIKQSAAAKAAAAQTATDKTALLAKLGISADEAKLLLS